MKLSFLFITFLLINLNTFAQFISFANSKIDINGDEIEWTNYNKNSEEYSKTNYSITNDNRYIYFLCKFKERATQLKVLRAGLEITIDTNGKNSTPVSIIFPYSSDRENNDIYSHSFTGIKANMDFESKKLSLIEKSKRIKLNGMKNGLDDAMLNKINSVNVLADLNFDSQNNLILELAIPIHLIFDGNIKTYKYPFSFQYNILGLPNNSNELVDNKYFENISFGIKSKLANSK